MWSIVMIRNIILLSGWSVGEDLILLFGGQFYNERKEKIKCTGCPKKKHGLVFRAHFRGLNDLKIIKVEENRPHLKLLGGVFRPVCRF